MEKNLISSHSYGGISYVFPDVQKENIYLNFIAFFFFLCFIKKKIVTKSEREKKSIQNVLFCCLSPLLRLCRVAFNDPVK